MRDHQDSPLNQTQPMHSDTQGAPDTRRDFVAPELRRHESLPKVTTGFVGTFVP